MISKAKWENVLLPQTALIGDAVRNLIDSSLQIVMVVDSENKFIGIVTDGDIRRGLVRGEDLRSPLASVIKRNPLVISPEVGRDVAVSLMKMNKIHQIPVIDEQRHILGLYTWDEELTDLVNNYTFVIMAGGKGQRLRPHTENCPKPLLPVGNKPMINIIIENAIKDGFKKFTVCIHYLGEMIVRHLGNGERWGVEIDYVEEPTPMGTAGGLAFLKDKTSETLLVTNGDVLTDIQYRDIVDFHLRHQAHATMAVRMHEWQHPFGVVQTKGLEICGFQEKPITKTYVNAGIYVLRKDTLGFLDDQEKCDMPELFDRARASGMRTIVYPMHEPWLDVGRIEDYEQANGK